MPSIRIHPHSSPSATNSAATLSPNPSHPITNPLPQLLQTPSGLALLELQGTINLPANETDETVNHEESQSPNGRTYETPVGKLMFPEYSTLTPEDTKWMKRAYLYIGRYQRMTGEVKKLPRPIAVLQRRDSTTTPPSADVEELEVLEIVRYKILFKNRPEPVNDV